MIAHFIALSRRFLAVYISKIAVNNAKRPVFELSRVILRSFSGPAED